MTLLGYFCLKARRRSCPHHSRNVCEGDRL